MARMSKKLVDQRALAKLAKRSAAMMHDELDDLLAEIGDVFSLDEEQSFQSANEAIVAQTVEETAAHIEKTLIQKKRIDSPDDVALKMEAGLLYYHLRGRGFVKQICPQCNREFAFKYYIPGPFKLKCSNDCRKAALLEIGIEYNPYKTPEQKWGGEETVKGTLPLIVPPDLYEAVQAKLKESGVLPEEDS